MNKHHFAGAAAFAAFAAAFAAEPVIMTVNGVDVPKSEFEYLYHKNSQQQAEPQSLDEYVEMFKIYKLKVADAREMRLDTLPSYQQELSQYTAELAKPYLTDSTIIYRYVDEAYQRGKEEVEFNHLMLAKGMRVTPQLRAKADSLRNLLLNGADFDELVLEYSDDKAAKLNHGHVGYITPGRIPYFLELAVCNTPEGQYSEVVESPIGLHIVKGGKHRPSRGTRLVQHIMKASPIMTDIRTATKAKSQIDSLYNLAIQNPDLFSQLATDNSDDAGSAKVGGQLPWFGAGEMVQEFDSVAFALQPGEISQPFKSQYGWHIVKVIDKKPYPTLEQARPGLVKIVTHNGDQRITLLRQEMTKQIEKRRNAKRNEKVYNELRQYIAQNGIDSLFYVKYGNPLSSPTLFTIDGNKKTYSVADFLAGMRNYHSNNLVEAVDIFETSIDRFYSAMLQRYEVECIEKEQPEYRNLLNEFREGSLLYEASVRRVWDKAAKDEAGLDAYFKAHKNDYTWTEPRVKGYLIQAQDDSVANLVRQRIAQLPNDSILTVIRKEFPRKQVIIDKVLATKGSNPMIDNLMFGGPEAQPSSSMLTVFFLHDARLIDAPEEYTDVRGLVTSDYQNLLEKEWVEELKTKYPVTVYDKELKKIR